jgi:transketolase
VVGAGITLHEALKAHEELKKENVPIRVIDLYSIKPLDEKTLREAARETSFIVTVEDHYPDGGLGEAVKSVLSGLSTPVYSLAVKKIPKSGKPGELLEYEGISSKAIVKRIRESLG